MPSGVSSQRSNRARCCVCGVAVIRWRRRCDSRCRNCQNARQRECRIDKRSRKGLISGLACTECGAALPPRRRAVATMYCVACRRSTNDECRARRRELTDANARRVRLRVRFGISPEEYDALVALQGNLCALCREPQKQHFQYFAIDHDHNSGAIRGLLCTPCNAAIGLLQESPSLLRRAAAYIEAGGIR